MHGSLLLVLHAHLPYIRHPEEAVFLEEGWLFEAITETYIPILHRMERLAEDGIPARLTMTWTPPLCEMLADPLLQQRYRHHLSMLLELSEQEVPAKADTPFAAAAVMYRDHFRFCLQQFDRFGGNILRWVRQLRDAGVIEPITCTATHGFLPLMLTPQARRAQIRVATVNHRKHFGADPKGIWLAECGYVPGIEEMLRDVGIRYFFVDTHGIYYGAPRPRLGVYHHVYTPSGVAAFGRDVETSRSVWSAEAGYPGHGDYREFYRDLGYDGGYDYVRRFLHPDGVRRNLGLKYHRITGKVDLHQKQAYQPDVAFRLAMDHAGDFCAKRIAQCIHLEGLLGRPPLITAPYDAELFGHWWYEGPQFIESIFRCLHSLGNPIRPVTGSEYLASEPIAQIVTPAASSWGDAGYNGVWLNPGNDWIYRHLHAAETRMVETARANPNATGLRRAVLDQMARELLLAQSSDWAFIMTTGTTVPYAVRRTKDHINRFTGLWESLQENRMDAGMVERIRWSDPIFEEIDYRVFA